MAVSAVSELGQLVVVMQPTFEPPFQSFDSEPYPALTGQLPAPLDLSSVQPRALREAAERKAKKIHFYKNGHPYSAKVTVSMTPRDFQTLNQLCRYLTERTQLHNGVQFVFTTNGLPITSLQELEHDQNYVISGTRSFQPHPYGVVRPSGPILSKTVLSGPYKTVREDDLRLLRPLSSKFNSVYAQTRSQSHESLGLWSPQTMDNRIVTIVNNQNHSITSRVMLNLKTPKSFETLLKDLGQTVRMPHPKRLFTSSGLQVRSVSHLKHDLHGVDLFYVDSVIFEENFHLKRVPSLESVERMVENSVRRLNQIASSSSTFDLRQNSTSNYNASIAPESSLSNLELFYTEPTIHRAKQNEVRRKNPESASSSGVPSSVDTTRTNKTVTIKTTTNQSSAKQLSNSQNNKSSSNSQNNNSSSNSNNNQRPSVSSQRKSKFSASNSNNEIGSTPTESTITNRDSKNPTIGGTNRSRIPISLKQNLIQNVANTTSHSSQNSFLNGIQSGRESDFDSRTSPTNGASLPETLTLTKFNQIQEYAEKIVAETEVAIRSELIRLSRSPSPLPVDEIVFPSKFVAQQQQQQPPPTQQVFKIEINPATPDTANSTASNPKSFTFPSKIPPPPTSTSSSSSMKTTPISSDIKITIEPPTEKRDGSSFVLNTENDHNTSLTSTNGGAQTPQPARKNSSTLSSSSKRLSISSDNLSKSTFSSRNRSTVPINKKPYLKRKTPTVNSKSRQLSPATRVATKTSFNNTNNNSISQKNHNSGNSVEKNLHKGAHQPPVFLELARIFGYNGACSDKRKNLFHLSTGELVFHCGTFAVLWNPVSQAQRFYCEHDNDILCLRTDRKSQFIASSQHTVQRSKQTIIRIWSAKTLQTLAVLKDKSFGVKIIDFGFTSNNLLFVVDSEDDDTLKISVWNWNSNRLIASTKKPLETDEIVFGGTVHPSESDIFVTYGRQHLVVWSLQKVSKTIVFRTALQTLSKISKTIYCADFLGDNSLLTGDSVGNLTIWAPFEANRELEFAIKEVKGHEVALTALKLTKDAILVSGDREGSIKTWDVNDGEFRLLNAIRLPIVSGSVATLALPDALGTSSDVYVGTSENFVLKGSILQTTSYDVIFEGHLMAVRSVVFDPREDGIFYTASLDQRVCKWSRSTLLWCVQLDIQAIACSVHPAGKIIAVGSVNGIITILETYNGQATQHLELTSVPIGCLAFSPDGTFLVAGCQDGNLHVLPVEDDGQTYSRVSVLKGPLPILTLQWSLDAQFILTSVDDNNYQELILWDLPNTRYIRNVTNFSDNLKWHSATCSGLDDARATWDNEALTNVVNICTHYSSSSRFIVTGDENGLVRVFSYPCTDVTAAFFEYKQGAGSVTDIKIAPQENYIVSCNFEGAILLWNVKNYNK